MAQYINKSALVADIERLSDIISQGMFTDESRLGIEYFKERVLSFLNTLEVKEVKEPAASDKGMADEIIINLKRVEQDYHIDLTREMKWLRSKVKKGE